MSGVVREVSSWVESAQATAAAATATRAAPAGGLSHFISSISGSYGTAQIGLLTLKQGATTIGRWEVHNSFGISFPSPIKIAPGTAVSAELAAGAATVVGVVTLTGNTL